MLKTSWNMLLQKQTDGQYRKRFVELTAFSWRHKRRSCLNVFVSWTYDHIDVGQCLCAYEHWCEFETCSKRTANKVTELGCTKEMQVATKCKTRNITKSEWENAMVPRSKLHGLGQNARQYTTVTDMNQKRWRKHNSSLRWRGKWLQMTRSVYRSFVAECSENAMCTKTTT